jgi:serine/threonine-protein kinase
VSNPETLQRFELEGKAAALIGHPGIVDVFDMGRTDDGAPYMVMEYLQGINLSELKHALGRFTVDATLSTMVPVLEALGAAHQAGVVHRDLKPANIFISVKPQRGIKVLDFGVSKFLNVGQRMTVVGTWLGTPAYMAPEQMMDGSTVGPSSDLYSVGAVLYAMLTGHQPFEGGTPQEMMVKALRTAPRPVISWRPEVPEGLSRVIDRLLEKSPDARPKSAREVLQDLRAFGPKHTTAIFDAADYHLNPQSAVTQVEPQPSTVKVVPAPAATMVSRVPMRTRVLGLGALGVVSFLVTLTLVAPWRAKKQEAPPVAPVLEPMAPPVPGTSSTPPPEHEERAMPARPAEPVVAPAAAREVVVLVRVEPVGATVSWEGSKAPCSAPCSVRGTKGKMVRVTAAASGFVSQSVDVPLERDGVANIALVADPNRPVVKPKQLEKKKNPELDRSNPYR